MQRPFLCLILCAILPSVDLLAAKPINVVPGASLGEVTLGESKSVLIERGFSPDPDRLSHEFTYLVKAPLLVLLKENKAVQICVENFKSSVNRLRYRGKRFPKKLTLETVAQFLGDCAQSVTGSGGRIQICAKGGVELTTTFPSPDVGTISVLKK